MNIDTRWRGDEEAMPLSCTGQYR